MEDIDKLNEQPQKNAAETKVKKEKKPKQEPWVLWTRDIIVCLILVLLFRANVAEANYIPSISMVPTLQVSDRIIVDKLSLRWNPLDRGELIVFHPPIENQETERWIKRVIGLPGDTVQVIRGNVYINGHQLSEPYIGQAATYSKGPITLSEDDPDTPENEAIYYLLGDNRRNSQDSHVWGPCPEDNIIGRAIFRYWPIASIGSLTHVNEDLQMLD